MINSLPYIAPAIQTIFIPDLIGRIVTKVSVALAKQVYYDWGHYTTIVRNLTEKDNSISLKNAKYPLVWLVTDFEERISKRADLYCELPKIQIIIAVSTDMNYTEQQRRDKSFLPVLYPIFAELINQFSLSPMFGMPTVRDMGYSKWDRPYWGNGKANIFNDSADVIEINNLNLTVKKICN